MSVLYIDTTNCLKNSFKNLHKMNLPKMDLRFMGPYCEKDKSLLFDDYDKFKKSLKKCSKIIIFTIYHITQSQYKSIEKILNYESFAIYTEDDYIYEEYEEYEENIETTEYNIIDTNYYDTNYFNMKFQDMKYRMF